MAVYTRKGFVEKYGDFINEVTKGTGILPGTLISQAIIESQGKGTDGNWYVGGSTLSQKANNFFGIKASKDWKGEVFNIDTGEYTPTGQYYVEKKSAFRKYNSVEDSIRDYVKFLQQNSRYKAAGVFTKLTVKDQALALKTAGYATSPTYADKINSVYEGIKSFIPEKKKIKIIGGLAILTGLFFLGRHIYRNYNHEDSKY